MAGFAACALLALDMAGHHSQAAVTADVSRTAAAIAAPGELSVMTYNVEGLPWPIARGRPPELQAIGARLAAMRRAGDEPRVALIQEAFIADAKAIAGEGGYRYVAYGPRTADEPRTPPLGLDFAQGARWLKGETEGKWVDSGLMILSDYPIVATRTMAFPDGACAGFDCLADKGVLIAWIRVPGIARPVAFADTHLNSRRASGVDFARADEAQAWQLAAARAFVARSVPSRDDLVFGGDFNIGHVAPRVRAATIDGGPLPGAHEAITVATRDRDYGAAEAADFAHVVHHGKDKQYFRPGDGATLSLARITVPFGTERDGSMLSDHMGYVADYRFAGVQANPSPRTVTSIRPGPSIQPVPSVRPVASRRRPIRDV